MSGTWTEVAGIRVAAEDDGKMIRDVVRARLQLSRRLMRKVYECSGLLLNGAPAFPGNRVHAGDLISLHAEPEVSLEILPEPIPISILYEDEDLLVVEKPAGMVVHPTHGHYTGTLANGVMQHWAENGERIRFRPLHRIDEETSGVLAIAKTHYASQKMSRNLKYYLAEREYLAIAEGHLQDPDFTIDAPIGRLPDQPHLRAVLPEGKLAVTHVRLVETGRDCSLARMRLETGRTHQIRVHMAYLGHPLACDKLYGRQAPGLSRHALHASTLKIVHPRTGEILTFHAPLPDDLAGFWQEQRLE